MKSQIHQIDIPSVLKVGNGYLEYLGQMLKDHGFKNVSVLFGAGLISLFGDTVFQSLKENEITVLYSEEVDTTNIEDITRLAFSFSNKTDAIIGIGGGKVIDAAKYSSFLRKLPFICVPTSSSSDAFSSSTASLLVDGKRTSVPARLAYAILVDLDIIKTSPEKFIYSGIGDMVSKITAIYDWIFERKHGVGELDDFALMISKKAVNSFVRTPFDNIKDNLFLRELIDSLSMSGIANEIAGSSAPTSGSEHLISHALDQTLPVPELHGIQVGIATYLMSKVQDHRYARVNQIFRDTGFWDYVKTLNLTKAEFERAIDLAPSIKPNRYTYLHEEKYRQMAKQLLYEDEILCTVLK